MNTITKLCDDGFSLPHQAFISPSFGRFSLTTQTPSMVDGTFVMFTEILTRQSPLGLPAAGLLNKIQEQTHSSLQWLTILWGTQDPVPGKLRVTERAWALEISVR